MVRLFASNLTIYHSSEKTLGETSTCIDKGSRKWRNGAVDALEMELTVSSMPPIVFMLDRERALATRSQIK
jgi:hypothetical protein